jgi:hypothetical protein
MGVRNKRWPRPAEAMNLVHQRYFQPLKIKCRVKSEVYNEVTRVKVGLMGATKIAFAESPEFYVNEICLTVLKGKPRAGDITSLEMTENNYESSQKCTDAHKSRF